MNENFDYNKTSTDMGKLTGGHYDDEEPKRKSPGHQGKR